MDDLLIGAKVKWTAERVKTISGIFPRHIGRIVQFDYYRNDDPTDYSHDPVMGSLDGYLGDALIVSGDEFKWNRVADLKIYRKELA